MSDPRSGTTEAKPAAPPFDAQQLAGDWRVWTGLAAASLVLLAIFLRPSNPTVFWLQTLRVVHVFSAITLVGFIVFNTVVLQPALKRIPPAHSTVVSQKIGLGMMVGGTIALVLLGLTGFLRLWLMGTLGRFVTLEFLTGPYGRWVALMVAGWGFLFVTGILSGVWYQTVLTHKLPYSAGLRDLEEKRAAQERVTLWQDRLYYWNVVAAVLAALGGAMAKF